MNPKKIKKIRNLVKKLVRQMLDDEPFRFTIRRTSNAISSANSSPRSSGRSLLTGPPLYAAKPTRRKNSMPVNAA